MIRRLLIQFWKFFLRLNLFESDSTDGQMIEVERWSTRLYLIAMLLLLSISSIISLSMVHSIDGYAAYPTQKTFEQLVEDHPSTLKCPCTQLSIAYGLFSQVNVQFHQVCSSSFVSAKWIQSIWIDDYYSFSFYQNDVRRTLSVFWQIIAGFCQLSDISINSTIERFEETLLLTPLALSENLLRTETRTTFDILVSSTYATFSRNLLALESATAGNQLVSGLATNFRAHFSSDSRLLLSPRTVGNCSCLNLEGCPRPSVDETFNSIPGLISDCLMIEGTLQSSLECYYNISCTSLLHPSESSIQTLKMENNHYSLLNWTLERLLRNFMIEQVFIVLEFDRFYENCRPVFCSYTYSRRFDLLHTITIEIGVYGGLSVILAFIVPILVKEIIKRKQREGPRIDTPPTLPPLRESELGKGGIHIVVCLTNLFFLAQTIFDRIGMLRRTVWSALLSLNLFKARHSDAEQVSRQCYTTRLFILLMTVTTTIIGIYIFFSIQTQIITISDPSLDIYETLYAKHALTLSCPCSRISIPYGTFLTLNYTLHQICSSTLISPEWLDYILASGRANTDDFDSSGYFEIDFGRVGPSYFQLLRSSCLVAKDTIDQALNTLSTTRFVNDRVLSKDRFIEQMQNLNKSVTSSIQLEFSSTNRWLYLTSTESQFLIGLNLNGGLHIDDNNSTVSITDPTFGVIGFVTEDSYGAHSVCSCRFTADQCQVVSVLYETATDGSVSKKYFPEMSAGCTPWLGLLQSNIYWWFSIDYVERIRQIFTESIYPRSIPNLEPLSNDTETRFRYEDGSYPKFDALFEKVLIEQWTGNTTRFDLFYEQCAPRECTYIIKAKRSPLAALLVLLSICSGLNRILRWVTSFTLLLGFFIIDKYRHHYQQRSKKLCFPHYTFL